MGMFDYIVSNYPLPDFPPALEGEEFQTKDTPPQGLEHHTISEDGLFSIPDFTGVVDFYTSNIVGGGAGTYTRNGEDAESVSYRATFHNSKLVKIERTEYERGPAMPSKAHEICPDLPYTAEEMKQWDGPMVGRTLFLRYGTIGEPTNGFSVEVLAEAKDSRKRLLMYRVAAADETAGFEVGFVDSVSDFGLGRTLFLSREDADKRHKHRKDWWDSRRKEWDDYCAAWRARNGDKP